MKCDTTNDKNNIITTKAARRENSATYKDF